jgi:hypothetical protein
MSSYNENFFCQGDEWGMGNGELTRAGILHNG